MYLLLPSVVASLSRSSSCVMDLTLSSTILFRSATVSIVLVSTVSVSESVSSGIPSGTPEPRLLPLFVFDVFALSTILSNLSLPAIVVL